MHGPPAAIPRIIILAGLLVVCVSVIGAAASSPESASRSQSVTVVAPPGETKAVEVGEVDGDGFVPSAEHRAAAGALQVFSLSAVVAFVASSGAPVAALLDAQALGVLSRSPCVDDASQYVLSGAAAVALPVPLASQSWALATHLAIGAVITSVLVARGISSAPSPRSRRTSALESQGPVPVWAQREVLAAARFPTVPLALLTSALPAASLVCGSQLFASDRDGPTTLAGVALLVLVVGSILAAAVCQRVARADPDASFRDLGFTRRFAYELSEDERGRILGAALRVPGVGLEPPDLQGQLTGLRKAVPLALLDIAAPRGLWWPPSYAASFGGSVGWMTPGTAFSHIGVANLTRVAMACAATAFPARTTTECAAQHGAIGMLHLLCALLLYLGLDGARVPLRRPPLVLSAAATGVASVALGHPLLTHLVPMAVAAACVAWLAALVVDVGVAVGEWALLSSVEDGLRVTMERLLRARLRRRPHVPTKAELRAAQAEIDRKREAAAAALRPDSLRGSDDDRDSDVIGGDENDMNDRVRRALQPDGLNDAASSATGSQRARALPSNFTASESGATLADRLLLGPVGVDDFDDAESTASRSTDDDDDGSASGWRSAASFAPGRSRKPPRSLCPTYVAPLPPTGVAALLSQVENASRAASADRAALLPGLGSAAAPANGSNRVSARPRKTVLKLTRRKHGQLPPREEDWRYSDLTGATTQGA